MSTPASQSAALLVVSAVEGDTLVETIYRPDTRETALAIAVDGDVRTAGEWQNGHGRHVPMRPTNNLLRHQALLLPSEPADYVDAERLVDDIETYIRRYVRLGEEALGVCTAYVLLSWVYDAFNELPYLRIPRRLRHR